MVMAKLTKANIWNIVRKTRNRKLYEQVYACQNPILLSYDHIKTNIDRIEEELNLNTTISAFPPENLTSEALKTAAELFTFLNHCPSSILISLIAHLFKNDSPTDILQALTSVVKSSSQPADKQLAVTVFTKVLKSFGLNQYEEIQKISAGMCDNGDCSKKTTNEESKG